MYLKAKTYREPLGNSITIQSNYIYYCFTALVCSCFINQQLESNRNHRGKKQQSQTVNHKVSFKKICSNS